MLSIANCPSKITKIIIQKLLKNLIIYKTPKNEISIN